MKLASSKKQWPWQKPRPSDRKTAVAQSQLVILRPKRLEDAEQDYAWRTDPELAALDATVPLLVTYREYYRYQRDDMEYPSPWSVRMGVDTLEGRHIGNCMYYDIDPDRKQCEMGIMIGDRDYWGRGYGTDAVTALLRHIFAETPIERVYLHTLAGNVRAQKAFARSGLKQVGDVRRDGYDFLKMEAWRDEWLAEHSTDDPAASSASTPSGQHGTPASRGNGSSPV